jgi:hypothetical protein
MFFSLLQLGDVLSPLFDVRPAPISLPISFAGFICPPLRRSLPPKIGSFLSILGAVHTTGSLFSPFAAVPGF